MSAVIYTGGNDGNRDKTFEEWPEDESAAYEATLVTPAPATPKSEYPTCES